MSFRPKDHARFFESLGRKEVERRIINGEFRGITLQRAREWSDRTNAALIRMATMAAAGFAGVGTVVAILVALLKR